MIVHRQEHSSRWLLEDSKYNPSKHPGPNTDCEWLRSLQERRFHQDGCAILGIPAGGLDSMSGEGEGKLDVPGT
jgi:hypothetical protein